MENKSYVAPGGQRTYFWYAEPPRPEHRRAGHGRLLVVPRPHGRRSARHGRGKARGLFGALIVRQQGDVKPARTYVTAFGDRQSINLRRGAATDTCAATKPVAGPTCLIAKPGERDRVRGHRDGQRRAHVPPARTLLGRHPHRDARRHRQGTGQLGGGDRQQDPRPGRLVRGAGDRRRLGRSGQLDAALPRAVPRRPGHVDDVARPQPRRHARAAQRRPRTLDGYSISSRRGIVSGSAGAAVRRRG